MKGENEMTMENVIGGVGIILIFILMPIIVFLAAKEAKDE